MVFPYEQCKECSKMYIDDLNAKYEWCKPCQIKYFKENFTNWSGNEIIDNLIQETQLKISDPNKLVFEWIPYDQFYDAREINNGNITTKYSAIWKDGPSRYFYKWIRKSNMNVSLKYCHNSPDDTNKLINEV
jgi:hypothetical protein